MDSFDQETLANLSASVQRLQLYILAFCLSCAAGMARTHRDHNFRDVGNLLSIGFVCGLIGFASYCVLVGVFGDTGGYSPIYIGITTFIGLGGKKADKWISLFLEWGFKKLGIEFEDPQTQEELDENETL